MNINNKIGLEIEKGYVLFTVYTIDMIVVNIIYSWNPQLLN